MLCEVAASNMMTRRLVLLLVFAQSLSQRAVGFAPNLPSSISWLSSRKYDERSGEADWKQANFFALRSSSSSGDLSNGSSSTKRRVRASNSGGRRSKTRTVFLRQEMLNHTILTREEEMELGTKFIKAQQLREAACTLIRERSPADEDCQNSDGDVSFGSDVDEPGIDNEDLKYLSVYGTKHLASRSNEEIRTNDEFGMGMFNLKDGHLSNQDVVEGLNLPGGHAELLTILSEGSLARETLIRNNVRLVASIAKNWAKKSGASSLALNSLVELYTESWDRPSLDEAIQEGIIGLAEAVERYDPSRGLKFSTYATWWITNRVRRCYENAITGCLRVPAKLHDIKVKRNEILRKCYEKGDEVPSEEEVANELGVNVARLRTALRLTERLVSTDAPLSFNGRGRGGKTDYEVLLSDMLKSDEMMPEDTVELSFLRQCLENAMATELSPYERDVLRLRHGLDDGVTRTVREVVEFCGGTVTMAEVRSAERRAFKKLRSPYAVHTYNLLAHLDFAGVDEGEALALR